MTPLVAAAADAALRAASVPATLLAAEEDTLPSRVTLSGAVTAASVLGGAVLVALVVGKVLERRVRKADSTPGATSTLARFVQGLIVAAGLLYALNALDVRIGPLLGALGIGGIALALATQSILSNAVASVLLQVRRPFRRGDQIGSGDVEGTVEDVNFRTVVLRSFEGERVYLPCAQVLDATIVNHTALGGRRTTLAVGVHYDTDLAVAQEALLRAVRSVKEVRPHPEPQAWVTTFGESSIDFDVRYWHTPDVATLYRVRSAVAMAIKTEFDRLDIEIPFPQRVVTHVVPPVQA